MGIVINNGKQTWTKRKAVEQVDYLSNERMLTMQEAMEYLTEKGFPCRSRSTFYKILNNFDIKYTNINPGGKNEVRRFPLTGLEDFLRKQGLEA